MSLLAAVRRCDDWGLKWVCVTPDGEDHGFALVTADRPLTPGQASIMRSRITAALQSHRHSHGEPAAVLDGPVTLAYHPTGPDTGAWLLSHEGCVANRLRRAS